MKYKCLSQASAKDALTQGSMYICLKRKRMETESGPFHCGLIPCEQLIQEHGTLPSGEKRIVALLSSQKVRYIVYRELTPTLTL